MLLKNQAGIKLMTKPIMISVKKDPASIAIATQI